MSNVPEMWGGFPGICQLLMLTKDRITFSQPILERYDLFELYIDKNQEWGAQKHQGDCVNPVACSL